MRFVPRKLFLTRGVGINKEKLNSFEMALRNAGIAHLNIVLVQYRMGGHIVDSTSITQTAEGASGGVWTSVVAAAVLL